MEVSGPHAYMYLNHEMNRCEDIGVPLNNDICERHRFSFDVSPRVKVNGAVDLIDRQDLKGVILALRFGYPTRKQVAFGRKILSAGRNLFFYWHKEKAIERIDRERLNSFSRLNWMVRVLSAYQNARAYHLSTHNPFVPSQKLYRLRSLVFRLQKAKNMMRILASSLKQEPSEGFEEALGAAPHAGIADSTVALFRHIHNAELSDRIASAQPVPLDPGRLKKTGYGAYIRLDFWAKINSGGSYGHTCYVAKELSKCTAKMQCILAHRYALIDDMGIDQSVLPEPGPYGDEETISNATHHYYPLLRAEFEKNPPTYIYERICLGNWVSVKLSQDLNIPYIVEYNGSEISMKKSFDGSGYQYEDFYLDCEEAAFRQATAISVVSEIIKDDLVARGIDPRKILVNPNGVDTEVYKPDADLRKAVRAQLGWSEYHRVVGFTGTFGGWHGVDVLAEAMGPILEQAPEARLLLIGDGNLKHLIDEQISKHHLEDRVYCSGRVPQEEGARLLAACDIFVSPHNSHMVDSRFFGSPTKIFEYMAMGGGIVSTDLEQIGEVLSPALRTSQLGASPFPTIENQRSILCEPGNVDEFIKATVFLVKNPEICRALGQNARHAAVEHYSWERHVQQLWQFIQGRKDDESFETRESIVQDPQGDEFYKNQARQQWDNDPCGSHYVKNRHANTLAWFEEAERYRHEEYAPWMPELMEFQKHAGDAVLEIGGGMGTDLAQFAKHGARIVDFDLALGHLQHAKRNFDLRGLEGSFLQGDAERIPFKNDTFDMVYSNGVLHHIPNMQKVIHEIFRVLKPGGLAAVMVYAENSKHYWESLVYAEGVKKGLLHIYSIGEIMSRVVEISEDDNAAKPLVKVYTRDRLRKMFSAFEKIRIHQCQLTAPELQNSRLVPKVIKKMPLDWAGRFMGWNLVIKARKPTAQ